MTSSLPGNQILFWVKTMRNNNRLHKYVPSLLLFLLFETVAVALWLAKGIIAEHRR